MTKSNGIYHYVADYAVDFTGLSTEEIRAQAASLQESMHLQVDGVAKAFATGDASLMRRVSEMLVKNTAFLSSALTELASR